MRPDQDFKEAADAHIEAQDPRFTEAPDVAESRRAVYKIEVKNYRCGQCGVFVHKSAHFCEACGVAFL